MRKVTITQFKFLLTFRFLWKTVDNKFEASLFATVGSNCRPLICKRMASVLITVTWQVFVWDFSNQNVSHYLFSKNQFNMKSISLVQMSMIFLLGDVILLQTCPMDPSSIKTRFFTVKSGCIVGTFLRRGRSKTVCMSC